ncbi:cytochrome B561 [Pseudomonas oryzihabitans]|nr:cytochrome B561 [Pseudomonas psychrotolerans]KTT45511.1 cytochrome B561 [Pseudomonas psychrotolerans]
MNPHYTKTAKALHWTIAIMIVGLIGLGFYMHNLPISPSKLKLYSWHKWAGVSVFLLALVRVLWRLNHKAPRLASTMGVVQRAAAHLGHLALYCLMFAIPLSGWIMSSAKGFQTVWFGVLPLPNLVSRDRVLGDQLLALHLWLNIALIALLSVHILAAFKHHFIDRDDTLTRMLPRFNNHH